MLVGLFRGVVADVVHEVLDNSLSGTTENVAAMPRRIAVVGDVALGRALLAVARRAASTGRPQSNRTISIVAEPGARVARTLREVVIGSQSEIPVPDRAFAALVGVGSMSSAHSSARLTEWVRTVDRGGLLVLVDRVPGTVATRQLLCAGVTEIEQRRSGRVVVTSGVVTHLLDSSA
jgi:poly(3-hydroxybutyrate) depolymerase